MLHNFCKEHNLPDPPVRVVNDGHDDGHNEEIDVPQVPRRLRLLAMQEQRYMIEFVQQRGAQF